MKLPKRVREEPTPPPAEHVLAILDEIHDPLRRILFITIEQGALRLGEAVGLRWADVDRADSDFGCHGPRPSATRPAGCTCPSG